MGPHALVAIGEVTNGHLRDNLTTEQTVRAFVVPCEKHGVGTRGTIHHADGRSSPIITSFSDRGGNLGVPVGLVLDGTRDQWRC